MKEPIIEIRFLENGKTFLELLKDIVQMKINKK